MVMERRRASGGLIPWRLFRELEEPARHFERIFNTPFLPAIWRHLPAGEKMLAPAIEVFEKEDEFVVKAELPGMKVEDVEVSVVDETLTIKGEKKTENEVKEEDYHHSERSYGRFYRSIGLPSKVDTKKIEANYEDGVLEISLPKAVEVKTRKITVSTRKEEKAT